MNNKQLFDSLNDADDKYIIEAVEDYPELGVEKKRGFIGVLKYALPCAACAAVLFAGVAAIGGHMDEFTPNSAKISDSAGIVIGDPLALPETDPATFWEGDLPVLPLRISTNDYLQMTGKKFSVGLDEPWASSVTGLDAKRGEAVYAVADGEVTFVGVGSSPVSDDLTVVIKHKDDLYTAYSTLDEDCGIPVKVGDTVKSGQVIGYAGIRLGFVHDSKPETAIGYGVYRYDPMEYLKEKTEYFEAWLNSGLVKPLDNAGDDFEFDNFSKVFSRNEKITPAPYGAEVYAVSPGEVVDVCDYGNGFGLLIEISHEPGIETTYYHLDSTLPHAERGDVVSAGDVIGHVSDSSFSGVSGLGYFAEDYAWIRDPR